jgi:hypothetical protein
MSKTRSSLKPSISRTETTIKQKMLEKPLHWLREKRNSLERKNEIILAQDRNIPAPNTG